MYTVGMSIPSIPGIESLPTLSASVYRIQGDAFWFETYSRLPESSTSSDWLQFAASVNLLLAATKVSGRAHHHLSAIYNVGR